MASHWPIPTGRYVPQVTKFMELSLQGHRTRKEGREMRQVRKTKNNQLMPLTFSQEVAEESASPNERDKEWRGRHGIREEENQHSTDMRGVSRMMKKTSTETSAGKNPCSKLILEQGGQIFKNYWEITWIIRICSKEFCSFEEKFEDELVIGTK